MSQGDQPDKPQEADAPDPLDSDLWRDDARDWYLELKQDESVIAPWLSLEWTGERMRARR